ncbi:MAG: PadR family transcriptional regulator [Cyanobacteriota bacterium]
MYSTFYNKGQIANAFSEAATLPKITSNEELFLVALDNKELYGKQICQAISDTSGGSREFKVGSLYPTLHTLEQKGLVISRWGDERPEERGGARRRYYRLTDDGVKALHRMRKFYADLGAWQPTPALA